MDIGNKVCSLFVFLSFESLVDEVLDGEKRRRLKSICKIWCVERHEAFGFLWIYSSHLCLA